MKRREFLTTTGLLAVSGTSTTGTLSAASTNKRSIRKAIMYETVKTGATVLDKFQAVKAAGFEGVEPSSHMDQAEVLSALKASGLSAASVCCSTHWKKPLTDPDPGVREEGLRGLQQALRDAKAYGASSVLLVAGAVKKNVSYDDAYKRSQSEIRKALPLAEQLGVKIAIENVWNQFLLSPLEAARFIDEFNSPAIGWHFDVGNVINYGWPEQWIHILGKRIQKLHIKEYSRAKRDKTGPSSGFNVKYLEGDNDWPAIMKALDDVGYTGWGIAEQPGGNSPEGLKELSDGMDRIFAS